MVLTYYFIIFWMRILKIMNKTMNNQLSYKTVNVTVLIFFIFKTFSKLYHNKISTNFFFQYIKYN